MELNSLILSLWKRVWKFCSVETTTGESPDQFIQSGCLHQSPAASPESPSELASLAVGQSRPFCRSAISPFTTKHIFCTQSPGRVIVSVSQCATVMSTAARIACLVLTAAAASREITVDFRQRGEPALVNFWSSTGLTPVSPCQPGQVSPHLHSAQFIASLNAWRIIQGKRSFYLIEFSMKASGLPGCAPGSPS